MEQWEVLNNGRIVVSSDPIGLWNQATDYFKWCKENPIIIKRMIYSGKKGGEHVEEEKPRAFTIKGLCMHCGITEEYLRDIMDMKDTSSLYYQIVNRILYVIHTQNLEYAMVDIFNPILTAKILNLEKGDTGNDKAPVVKIVGGDDLPELATSENEVLEKLEFGKSLSENEDLENEE